MTENNFFESKTFRAITLCLAGFIVLVFVFGLGVFVGTKRANFSFRWAEEYHRNFAGPRGGFFGNMMGGDFMPSNGVFGQIIKIAGQNLTVKGSDNAEKIIVAGDKTEIIFQRKNIKISDLKISDNIITIGSPNESGQIVADLIRVVPPPPQNFPR